MGEKGSIINIIKDFFRRLKLFFKKKTEELKEKNKKRKEEKLKKDKIKKYNKIEIFGKSVLGFFVGIFENISNKEKPKKTREINIEKELKSINRNILNIENQIENETTPIILKMYKKQINKNIEKLKNMKNLKNREDSKKIKDETEMLLNIKDKITIVENKLEGLKTDNVEENNDIELNLEMPQFIRVNAEENNKKVRKQHNNPKKENKLENIKQKTILIKDKIKTSKVLKETTNKIKKTGLIIGAGIVSIVKNIIPEKEVQKQKRIKKEENHKLKNKIKDFNNTINKTYNEISKIKHSIYDESKELELLVLKDKIIDLKKEYLELSKNLDFVDVKQYKEISNIDPNHLCYHDKSIDNLIDYLDLSIREVKTKSIQKREEKPKKVEKKFEIDVIELKLITDSINKDTEMTKKEIEKIKNKIDNCSIKNKKKTIISSISNFFRNSINIGISLIPFGIFRNKLLATLTSGIILNNRIRCMRSIVNNEEVFLIDYENMLNNIKDKKNCLEKTNYVLSSTIKEVANLKTEIEINYDVNDIEVSKLVKELEEMNLDLIKENIKIENSLEEMAKEKEKIKKKVA